MEGVFATINITRVICWDSGFALHRLRSAPFEGVAIGIPPALPEDCYYRSSRWTVAGPDATLPQVRCDVDVKTLNQRDPGDSGGVRIFRRDRLVQGFDRFANLEGIGAPRTVQMAFDDIVQRRRALAMES